MYSNNSRRLGLIQPRGIGDIVISLPIAKYYHNLGFEIHMPIFKDFRKSFEKTAPYVHFYDIDSLITVDDYYYTPLKLLRDLKCDLIFNLMSHMSTHPELVQAPALSKFLKFDEYKYALTKVPFHEKWNLSISRDSIREQALFEQCLAHKKGKYIVIQTDGSNINLPLSIFSQLIGDRNYIQLTNITDNIFDWLKILECADELILIDSSIANIVEQLNFKNTKKLILRSNVSFTPVFKNGWEFITLQNE